MDYNDNAAIFISDISASAVASLMNDRPDVRAAAVSPKFSRGELVGYRVVAVDTDERYFYVSDDMYERLKAESNSTMENEK